jgi:eukaryotic-like serine/threonine-protein kinase
MQFGRFTVDPHDRRDGGQAFVYFAVDPITDRRVAVKVARPSGWSRKRLKREIETQEKLNHPNIPRVVARDDAFLWYVTNRAECSLEDLGALSPQHWPYLRVGLMGVASAVAYAHSSGYIHRDISAGNVLVYAQGWAVSDWGFVFSPPKGGLRMTQPLERFGTPEFMAPEMAIDPMNVGTPADIFSIGRLAAWCTGLKRGQSNDADEPIVRWWRVLIDGTTAYEPNARWTIQDVETHLRSTFPVERSSPLIEPRREGGYVVRQEGDACPQCRSQIGRDQAERCLACHALVAY